MLGSLDGFTGREKVSPADMPELERLVLHRLVELDGIMHKAIADFDFHTLWTELHNFCANDLSAFYFDIRKDSLYCDAPDALRRRACRTVLDRLFEVLVTWLAPIASFTADEAYLIRRFGSIEAAPAGESVHLLTYAEVPAEWRDDALAARWATVRDVRRVINGALEKERAEKRIRGSVEAAPTVYVSADQATVLEGLDLAEIAIVSSVDLRVGKAPPVESFMLDDVAGCGVIPTKAEYKRCERCWQHLPDVGSDPDYPKACGRCASAVRKLLEAT